MKTRKLFCLGALAFAITISGCKKDDPEPEPTPAGSSETTYNDGIFITNEGPFGSGTGTLSFYSRGSGLVYDDIFELKNGYPLGNIVQSMEIYNGKAYIVVNNAGKVEVADGNTFASSGAITGFTYPRYFLGINSSKGYVSEWGSGGMAGAVKVVDLATKTVTATISTGKGAEAMVLAGSKVYVACGGGFGNDSVVTVINSSSNGIITNIPVGANPKSMKMDANGKIWVLCAGMWDATYTTLISPGRLIRIDTATNAVDLNMPFASTSSQPSNLVIDSDKNALYYCYNGAVHTHPISLTALTGVAVINRSFYGLGIDPLTDFFYGSDAGDFVSNGKVIRYNPFGVVVDSVTVGVIPGGFYFK